MRTKEPTAVLTAIFIAIGALGCFMFVIVARLQSLQAEVAATNVLPVDVSGWDTYRNDTYGFELEYPAGWSVDESGLSNSAPFVAIGDPLSGAKTYALQVFIEQDPGTLSSGAYAHSVLDADKAADAQNATSGPAPKVTPQFQKSYVLTVGGYAAYELYGVFEFDHNAERIYVAHGNEVLRFDFPVAEENPNLSLPVANNGVAHQIMNTLVFAQ